MEEKYPDEVQRRKRAFEAFLGRRPCTKLEGPKREAVEKVFFFSEQQFNEVCEDLLEEIERREKKRETSLGFIPEFSLKRNTIREQMSLLEKEDILSLVEDTLLILNHKYPESPEDRLDCLNQLVDGLQEIVASNIPHGSPATTMKTLEQVRHRIETEQDILIKVEYLLESLAESSYDTSPHTQELFQLVKQSIQEEKKKKNSYPQPAPPELLSALENLCKKKGRKEYHQQMISHNSLEDKLQQKKEKEKTTVKEFLFLANSFINDQQKEKEESLSPQASLEASISKVIISFEELEYEIANNHSLSSLQDILSYLHKEKPSILKAFQEAKYNTPSLEDIPNVKISSEKEAIDIARMYWSAITDVLP